MSFDLFLLAGEPSGDLQGAKLIEALLQIKPDLKIAAVAGPRMRNFPIVVVEEMEKLQVMGFIDVVAALPKMAKLFFALRRKILECNPKAFVGIDYPGFNLRMERSLKKNGFQGKLIHYICPTVWAWGKKRIPMMAENLDLLLTILPFEPDCFHGTNLKAEYVGHPLTTPIKNFAPDPTFRSRFGFQEEDKILALFPGSREKEVKRNLPLMLRAAEKIKDPKLKIAISMEGHVPFSESYNLMRNAHLAIAKSGTVALELALHKTPTVVCYAIKPLDVFLATKIFRIKLPYYSLPNLLLQKEVFPELFGPNLTDNSLFENAARLWEHRNGVVDDCNRIWDLLGKDDASANAARKILDSAI